MSVILKRDGDDYILENKVKISFDHTLKLNKTNKFNTINSINFNERTKLWHCSNYKSNDSLIKILYGNYNFDEITFINGDTNDYRPCNLKFKEEYNNIIPPYNYKICKIGEPVTIENGACAKEQRNMYWKVEDENKNTYYLMHIKDNIFTKISKRDINKVLFLNNKRPTWRLFQNGYVCCTISIDSKQKVYYLHQYIMDVHNEDLTDYEKTIDHINRDKLDNRRTNLRFATMTEQNTNKDKATRRGDAKTDLPIWLDELPKYVQYRKEIYDKVNNTTREFFIIQHPNQDKIWESSKSNNMQLIDKFKATKLKLQLLDNLITETQYLKESGLNRVLDLPVGITILDKEGKYYFIYDYKSHSNRYNFKRTIQTNDIQNELDTFISDMNIKYPLLNYPNYIIKNQHTVNLINNKIIPNEKLIISEEIELPPNFTIYTEKILNI